MRSYNAPRSELLMNRVVQRAVQCSWSAREHLHDLRAGHRHHLFQPLKRAAGALEHGQDVKETQGDSGWRYLSREGSSAVCHFWRCEDETRERRRGQAAAGTKSRRVS